MTADRPQPVVLDATVLSNFASTAAIDQLVATLDRPVTVPAVRDELERGSADDYGFLKNAVTQLDAGIPVHEPDDDSITVHGELRERLDPGEAAALLVALECSGTLATDDLAARRSASDRDVPVTGSVGVLALGVQRGVVDVETANGWLSSWREERGYYAPVDRIEALLE